MAINLQKGQRINVGLSKVDVGLGWKPAVLGKEADLDASVFMVGKNGKLPEDEFFIFYNNLQSPDGAVQHTGDVQRASGDDEDEETISVDLDKVDPRIEELIFVVTIHDAEKIGQNFGQVKDAYIRVIDQVTQAEMMRYELSEDFSIETAVTIGRFYRRDREWRFEAMGTGNRGGLAGYLNIYN
ncbi:MAG: tellurium resistance protein TerD [Bacteroidota bacterium]|jgi:tellurium resistance protein TerD